MVTSTCPHCHSSTEYAAKCPYCPNCGWNRDAAIKSVRLGLMVMPLALAGFLASLSAVYFASAGQTRGGAMPPSAVVFFCIIPVILLGAFVYLRRKLAELRSLPEQASRIGN
jgi:hypothetical protein